MTREHALLVLCLVVSTIALILGSVAVNRQNKDDSTKIRHFRKEKNIGVAAKNGLNTTDGIIAYSQGSTSIIFIDDCNEVTLDSNREIYNAIRNTVFNLKGRTWKHDDAIIILDNMYGACASIDVESWSSSGAKIVYKEGKYSIKNHLYHAGYKNGTYFDNLPNSA